MSTTAVRRPKTKPWLRSPSITSCDRSAAAEPLSRAAWFLRPSMVPRNAKARQSGLAEGAPSAFEPPPGCTRTSPSTRAPWVVAFRGARRAHDPSPERPRARHLGAAPCRARARRDRHVRSVRELPYVASTLLPAGSRRSGPSGLPTMRTLASWLGPETRVRPVPISRDTPDWTFGSFWAHPERVLDERATDSASGFARLDPGRPPAHGERGVPRPRGR